ncbi:MAG TPA: HlyC/CorC family transporter [Candidatus Pelethenecus faecipullorum]|uniref:HlyC/CorC family transporter n=1 Tax=Candidatus Pelethenecus faecipullorum TaxID=2840900 RepID=A0A9D1GQR6_9MOLU|nr:HlyC/CorC family transporter [Candidatus Pelethenecus faecipullorum]
MESMIGSIILQVVLIFLNAVFASAEIAVIQTNETKVNKLAEEGNKRARKLSTLISKPAKFLSTIQVAITLAGLLGSAFAAENFARPLTDSLIHAGLKIDYTTLHTICVILITFILAYFNIVFGELIPKRIAMRKAEKMAFAMAGMLRVVSIIFAPLVWLLTVSTNGILRLFGINPDEEDKQVTEEEILLMAEAGKETGTIDDNENEFIQKIFDFKDVDVIEACTHRKDMDLLFLKDSDDVWKKTINESRHTYYPVCDQDADNIVGVLNTKIYFRLNDQSRESVLKQAVQVPMFVLENMQANTLFNKMKKEREYFAVVVDEYGGTSGIVTIHDLIELIVGEIEEKDELTEYEINKLSENQWEIIGLAPFDEVEKQLSVSIPLKEDEEFETFGGYICTLLDEIPVDGETDIVVKTDRLSVRILTIHEHTITKMLVSLGDFCLSKDSSKTE